MSDQKVKPCINGTYIIKGEIHFIKIKVTTIKT